MTKVLNLGETLALSYDKEGSVTLEGSGPLGDSGLALVEIEPVQSNALSWEHLLALREEPLFIWRGGELPDTSHGLLSAGYNGGGLLTSRQARMRMAIALACDAEEASRRAFDTFSPLNHCRSERR